MNIYSPTDTRRAWPEEMKDGDQIAVLLPRGYWTIAMLDGELNLFDFHDEDKTEIGVPVLYSDVLPVTR
jgi:hypothetical protein